MDTSKMDAFLKKAEEKKEGAGFGGLFTRPSAPLPGTPFQNAIKNFSTNLGAATAQGLAGGVATGALTVAAMGASRVYDSLTKARDFRAMLRENPDLHESYKQDPKRMASYFTAMRNMSADLSSQPHVAGHFMKAMMEDQSSAGGVLLGIGDMASKLRFQRPVQDALALGAAEGAKGSLGAAAKSMYANSAPPGGTARMAPLPAYLDGDD